MDAPAIGLVLLLALICTCIFFWREARDPSNTKLRTKAFASMVLILAMAIGLAVSFLKIIWPAPRTVSLMLLSDPLIIFPALFLGALLYRLRGTTPLLYGLIEIIVGTAVTSFASTSPTSDPVSKAVGIIGGIYIIVRGLDNIEKDLPLSMKSQWYRIFPKRS
jgi:hypothetical protein